MNYWKLFEYWILYCLKDKVSVNVILLVRNKNKILHAISMWSGKKCNFQLMIILIILIIIKEMTSEKQQQNRITIASMLSIYFFCISVNMNYIQWFFGKISKQLINSKINNQVSTYYPFRWKAKAVLHVALPKQFQYQIWYRSRSPLYSPLLDIFYLNTIRDFDLASRMLINDWG